MTITGWLRISGIRWVRFSGTHSCGHSLGGSVRQLTIARNQDRRLELFAVSFDQNIVHRWQVGPNEYFDDWHSLGGSFTSIDAVELGDGRIELLARRLPKKWKSLQARNGQQ